MNIKEMLIYDLDKLTNEEIGKVYRYVRRDIIAQIPGREPVKLEERDIPNVQRRIMPTVESIDNAKKSYMSRRKQVGYSHTIGAVGEMWEDGVMWAIGYIGSNIIG